MQQLICVLVGDTSIHPASGTCSPLAIVFNSYLYNILGRTRCSLCPFAVVLTYAGARGSQPGPLFVTSAARALTKQEFVCDIRRVLVRLGLPGNEYARHSFHIGAGTSAAMAGVEDSSCWVDGKAQHSSATSGLPTRGWRPSPLPSWRRLAVTEPQPQLGNTLS